MLKLITKLLSIVSLLRSISWRLGLKSLSNQLGSLQSNLYIKRENLKVERALGISLKDLNKMIVHESDRYIQDLNKHPKSLGTK